jgi:hypothetical protein
MVIGSGIFGLPAILARLLGDMSPWAYLVAAVGNGAITACLAEVGSQFSEAGGPYLYARVVYGQFAGIQIAWVRSGGHRKGGSRASAPRVRAHETLCVGANSARQSPSR